MFVQSQHSGGRCAPINGPGIAGAKTQDFHSQHTPPAQTRDGADEVAATALLAAVAAHSGWTAAHSRRVASTASQCGAFLGLDARLVRQLYIAGLVHDVGKLFTPQGVLDKPGALDEREARWLREHPVHSERVIMGIGQLRPLQLLVRHHHERYDGGGYPDGVKAHQLPVEVRLLTIVDAWDAMLTDRPYRRGLFLEQARAELHRHAGTQFDPQLVTAFIDFVSLRHNNQMRRPHAIDGGDDWRSRLPQPARKRMLDYLHRQYAGLAHVAPTGVSDLSQMIGRLVLDSTFLDHVVSAWPQGVREQADAFDEIDGDCLDQRLGLILTLWPQVYPTFTDALAAARENGFEQLDVPQHG